VSTVFLDTVGLVALWDRSDQWHAAASQAYQRIKDENCDLITSRSVLLECGNAAARRPYRLHVVKLKEAMEEDQSLVDASESDWRSAWDAFARGQAGEPGIVDQTSFAIMRRLGIHQAFTNDRHFTAAGFETLF
jgi:predicted nucleic acid-binding protein